MPYLKKSIFLVIVLLTLGPGCRQKPNRPVFLNLMFNQNQLLYEDMHSRQIVSPLPRFYVLQAYYGLAHRVKKFSDIHLTVNINPLLIKQIEDNYLDRLKPNIHLANETLDIVKFRESYLKKTDPWLDMLATDTWTFSRDERDLLYNLSGNQTWHCLSVDESVLDRFPDYRLLLPDDMTIGKYSGKKKRTEYSLEDKTNLKFLFNLSAFDPVFLRGAVQLPIRNENYEWVYSKVHKWVRWDAGIPGDPSDDTYHLVNQITEDDCHQLIVEIYKVLAAYLPAYRRLVYDDRRGRGQVELTMTPMYNAPLPLVLDSDLGDNGMPGLQLPNRFTYPDDAKWQLRLSIAGYKSIFDRIPAGIWSDEGVPPSEMLNIYGDEGIFWLPARLKKDNLSKKAPKEADLFSRPYSLKSSSGAEFALFPVQANFSRTLSEAVSANKTLPDETDFLNKIRTFSPGKMKEPLITVLDNDQYRFQTSRLVLTPWSFYDSLFIHLDSLYKTNELITVTPMEFIKGSKTRSFEAHPLQKYVSLDSLLINRKSAALLDPWIGRELQNLSWEYLRQSRDALTQIRQIYNPDHPNSWILRAWREMFIAENGDWFKTLTDENHFTPRQRNHLGQNQKRHMLNVFYYLNRAGFDLNVPSFPDLIQSEPGHLSDRAFTTDPTINGRKDKLWAAEGSYLADADGLHSYKKNDILNVGYWGFDSQNAYFALEMTSGGFEKRFIADSVQISFLSFPPDKKRLSYDERNTNPFILKSQVKGTRVFHFRADSARVVVPDTLIQAGLNRNFMEFSIPWSLLEPSSSRFQFFIQIRNRNKILDYFPNAGFIEFKKQN